MKAVPETRLREREVVKQIEGDIAKKRQAEGTDHVPDAEKADFGVRLRDLSPLYLYHSRDDPEVPFDTVERYSRAFPQAIVRDLDRRGHEFNQSHFPELAADIRGLAGVTERPGRWLTK